MSSPATVWLTLALLFSSLVLGSLARRYIQTTVDFYLAGRRIGYLANASAICGDYFSAASFLGVAAAVYAVGYDGLLYGLGFGAGFLPVLLFVAAPLRRSGAFTLPSFCGLRFASRAARLTAVALVLVIVTLYLVPQMIAAGSTWTMLVGYGLPGITPYATGVTAAAVIMTAYVVLGGMRATTWNQVVQFGVLLSAVVTVLVLAYVRGFRYLDALAELGRQPVAAENRLHPGLAAGFLHPGLRFDLFDQISLLLSLVFGTAGLPHIMHRYFTSPTGAQARRATAWVLGLVTLFYVLTGAVGVAARAMLPGGPAGGGGGTVVEPGSAGRQAAAEGAPPVGVPPLDAGAGEGAVAGTGMAEVPEVALRDPDMVVPALAWRVGGDAVLALVAAGAFAAIYSTIGGLLIAAAAAIGHDLYEELTGGGPEQRRVLVGRLTAAGTGGAALAVGLAFGRWGPGGQEPGLFAQMVTWAFAVAASGFFPVLTLGIWWRGMTAAGAVAAMVAGGGGSLALILWGVGQQLGWWPAPAAASGLDAVPATFPTAVTLPLGFAAGVAGTLLDRCRRRHPIDESRLDDLWTRMHGTAAERQAERLARIALAQRWRG
ncbi:Na+/solute symporter [Thermaerobacter marianensis DSM 12885]|uniref:Na+/solute symporter n=1 Tax=Thermaerobacter marianensis (strain ATCC 700841 / DSM 12885 / JCM 10246 / 7p75a) TaxID=644966 RepID=E6SGL2_THEM7|nr:cation acetate symporter [Thermaerobacter marianensis]ADU50558.1 Na+/solute symporter [Thermaerobacter marianensis DSM 12885]